MKASSDSLNFEPGAYFTISGVGDFGSIFLSLPMKLSNKFNSSPNENTTDDGSTLVFDDDREISKRNESFSFKTYRTIALNLSAIGDQVTTSIPFTAGPFTSGIPMSSSYQRIEYSFKEKKFPGVFFPIVETIEVGIDYLPGSFEFDPHGQFPTPEFFSIDECRWISGISVNERPHSSISTRMINRAKDERVQLSRIRSGIRIGVWTSIFVIICIDFIWTMVDLLKKLFI